MFGLLWAGDVTREVRGEVPALAPEARVAGDGAVVVAAEEPLPASTRC